MKNKKPECNATADIASVDATISDVFGFHPLQMVLDNHTMVAISDLERKFVYVNKKFRDITKYTNEELMGQLFGLLNSKHHPKSYIDNIYATLENGDVWQGQTKNRAKDGSFFWLDMAKVPLKNDEGQITHYVTVGTDISKQKNVEEALQQQQAELEAQLQKRTEELEKNRDFLLDALNAMPAGIGISDNQGRVSLANTELKKIFPDMEKHIEDRARTTDVIKTQFPDTTDKEIEQILGGSYSWSERQLPDGRWFKIERSAISDGGAIGIYSDITDFKEQQNTLQNHTDELWKLLTREKNLNQLQRDFVSMVSHEFRTPLAIIDSAAQSITRQKDKLTLEYNSKKLDKIRRAVGRMTKLMETTLSDARLEATGLQVAINTCDIATLIKDVILRQLDISQAHNIELQLENLPETIQADTAAIDQALTNVLTNAVKYSPKNPDINVRAWCENDHIYIAVRDQGIGIDQDDIPKMFGRFFRARTATGTAGTGIGLNLSQNIVQAHGGNIVLDSKKGIGTTFTIVLPVSGSRKTISATPNAA